MHFTNFQFNSQLFTTIHNFSLPFFLSLVKLLNAGICISGIRTASGGVNLPKWTSSRHFRTSHSTQVHHITFYLVNPSVPLNGWVTTPPKKKAHKKNKNQFTTFHNYSQLFTFFHNFSQFFTTFHQPSQFCSGFRVVKICENLSHFVKICEMHTPREAPTGTFFRFCTENFLISTRQKKLSDPAIKRYRLGNPSPLGFENF